MFQQPDGPVLSCRRPLRKIDGIRNTFISEDSETMMPVDDETHPVWMRLRHPGHGECVAWPGRRHGHRPPSCVQDPQRPALPIPVSWKSVAYRLLHGPPMLFTAPGKLSRPACPVRHAVLSGSQGVTTTGSSMPRATSPVLHQSEQAIQRLRDVCG
ncbi:hypothetical protein VTN31DRAFT_486 [Thermomyces dupontii]|uniref:uncharacterized protein n=1 Tax=Talaromyces thermophilus TaxID=28565 RepID=UPI003743F716